MIAWLIVILETLWLATIYSHRFFDWLDESQARLDELLDEIDTDRDYGDR